MRPPERRQEVATFLRLIFDMGGLVEIFVVIDGEHTRGRWKNRQSGNLREEESWRHVRHGHQR